MALVNVKLRGVHIHHTAVQTFKDGTHVTDCLVDEADLPTLKATKLVDWDSTQLEADLPAEYKTDKGVPIHVWAGFEPKAQKPQVLGVAVP